MLLSFKALCFVPKSTTFDSNQKLKKILPPSHPPPQVYVSQSALQSSVRYQALQDRYLLYN